MSTPTSPSEARPPRVSVIIPAYNRARFIAESIQSVLDQTYPDLEVIVVDDGSTDNTAEVVGAFRDPRVRYIYQANRGVSGAFNTGWRAARGEFLGLQGSDDVWLPTLLEEHLAVLDAHPEVGLVYARAQAMDVEGRPLSQILGAPEKFPGETLKSLLYGDFVCGQTAVMRRSCLERAGGFDETIIANEDWELWIRMAQHCRFAFQDKILGRYRIHPTSLTGSRSEHFKRLIEERVRVVEHFYAQPHVPPEVLAIKSVALRNVYLDAALRYLATGRRREAWPYLRHVLRVAPNLFITVPRLLWMMLFFLYLSKRPWGVRLSETLVRWRRGQRLARTT